MSETFTADQVRERLRAACDKAGSIRAWARDNDVTHAYVAGVLAGTYPPTRAVTHALGLKKIVAWTLDMASEHV
jgi:hypothetical protein